MGEQQILSFSLACGFDPTLCAVNLWHGVAVFCFPITISDHERISRWGRTHPSREGLSRQRWDPSWHFPRSAGCTTATNDGPPETLPSLI